MPVYEYECPDCGNREEKFVKNWADKHYQTCTRCKNPTDAIVSLTAINPDWEPYYDEVFETHIESRAHRRALMKEHGLVEKNKTIMRSSDKGKWI